MAERRYDYPAALRAYRDAEAAAPGTRDASRAAARRAWIEARRDPRRGYVPLAQLEAARRDPSVVTPEGLLSRARRWSPGRVRREAMRAACEGLLRADRAGASARCFEELLREPGITSDERRAGRLGLADARVAHGERARALDELERAGLGASAEAAALRAARTTLRLHWAAIVALALCAALALVVARPWRLGQRDVSRALSPLRMVAAAWTLGAPLVLVRVYEPSAAGAFDWFAAGAGVTLVLCALCAEALGARDAGRGSRFAVAAAAVVAHGALALLALEHLTPRAIGL